MELLLFIGLIVFIIYAVKRKKYEKTEYYIQTRNPYTSVNFDKGRAGEFYTYKYLMPLKGYKRFLFNLYLPKGNGETTELDIVLLHESGVYVFESKNYSGWIFGTESQQYWTQTFPTGKGQSQKSHFFNPILQNEIHLRWIQNFLADQTLPFYSYIVFSDRCTLKNITLTSGKHYVVNHHNLLPAVWQNTVKAGIHLSPEKIDCLYNKLYPLTQIDNSRKATHIENVQWKQQNFGSQIHYPHTKTMDRGNIRCPHCGGKLVKRTATKGIHQGKDFLGCSNYPKCRYIKNL